MFFFILGLLLIFASYKFNRWNEQASLETYGRRKTSTSYFVNLEDLGALYIGLLTTILGINELLKPYIHEALLHFIIGILSLIAGRIIKKRVQYFAEDNFDIFLGKFPEYIAYIVALFNFLDVIFWD